MLDTEFGTKVKKEYLQVGKSIRDYEFQVGFCKFVPKESQLYKEWADSVEQIALAHLKNFILREDEAGAIVINFHPELSAIIKETKYLDQLISRGQKIPETALSVTLQVLHFPPTWSPGLGGKIPQIH
jgi:hypothetical protein